MQSQDSRLDGKSAISLEKNGVTPISIRVRWGNFSGDVKLPIEFVPGSITCRLVQLTFLLLGTIILVLVVGKVLLSLIFTPPTTLRLDDGLA